MKAQTTKLREAARELLLGIAYDGAMGAKTDWAFVKRVEARFRLVGWTINRLMAYEDTATAYRAKRMIAKLTSKFEPLEEIERMMLNSARTNLADIERVRGKQWVSCV